MTDNCTASGLNFGVKGDTLEFNWLLAYGVAHSPNNLGWKPIMGDVKMKLKPCPFCGGEPSLNIWRQETHRKDGYMIFHNCSLFGQMHTYWFTYKTDAINAWNRRSSEKDKQ